MGKSKKTTQSRCTGHCCQKFTIPLSPQELREAYDRWLRTQNGYPVPMNGHVDDGKLYQDIHLIAPMVVHLGEFKTTPIRQVNPLVVLGKNRGGHYYRCKHFDSKEKKCTIYETRPHMCRSYPNGKTCNYAACTWKSHKAKKKTRSEIRSERKAMEAGLKQQADPGGS